MQVRQTRIHPYAHGCRYGAFESLVQVRQTRIHPPANRWTIQTFDTSSIHPSI